MVRSHKRLNCGSVACFFLKLSCVMDWSFFWVVSVVKRLRRLRESNMSLSISLMASMRVFGPIFVRLSGCRWFVESRNCFCEHIPYCVSVGKCGAGIRLLSGVPQNFGILSGVPRIPSGVPVNFGILSDAGSIGRSG